MNKPLRRVAPSIAGFVAIRLLGLIALAVWAGARGKSAHTLLSARWDSLWYVRVIERGYDFKLRTADGRTLSDMAFFPLFPWLEKAFSTVLPLSPADAGLLVSAVASILAAAGIFFLVEGVYGARAALFTVALWAALPVGIVQSMAYSESLFTALAAWGVYFAVRERWTSAGLLALFAGLTRPVGLAVAAAVWVAVAQKAYASGRWSNKALPGVVLAPLGFVAYFAWVGVRTDDVLGYLHVQNGWGNGFDGGGAFAGFVGDLLIHPPYITGVLLIAGVALLIWVYRRGFTKRYPLPLQVYTGLILVLALCTSGFFGSKPRLLIPAFSVLMPAAAWLADSRRRRIVWMSILGVLIVGSALYGAFWLNGSGPP